MSSFEKEAADALERLKEEVKTLHESIRGEALPERPSADRSPRLPTDDDRRLRPIGERPPTDSKS